MTEELRTKLAVLRAFSLTMVRAIDEYIVTDDALPLRISIDQMEAAIHDAWKLI